MYGSACLVVLRTDIQKQNEYNAIEFLFKTQTRRFQAPHACDNDLSETKAKHDFDESKTSVDIT